MTNLRKELSVAGFCESRRTLRPPLRVTRPARGDEQEAEGPHAAPQVGVGALRSAAWGREVSKPPCAGRSGEDHKA